MSFFAYSFTLQLLVVWEGWGRDGTKLYARVRACVCVCERARADANVQGQLVYDLVQLRAVLNCKIYL